jgi:arsenite-transporting ATPase
MMEELELEKTPLTKYLFFTGKGGVGKTSLSCAVAVKLAAMNKKVLLISTDPASNLQDVFERELPNEGIAIPEVPNLVVANLDPLKAAAHYREAVVGPYRGKLPDAAIKDMEEQLSGSCTVEIAAFDEFASYLGNEETNKQYDHIIFDTAPTGHTIRFLALPSAWNDFVANKKDGASCIGQLSGLGAKRGIYRRATGALNDPALTTLFLVTRPDKTAIKEASRASEELSGLGLKNQRLVINGYLSNADDAVSFAYQKKQDDALRSLPENLKEMQTSSIPLRPYNIVGLEAVRCLFSDKTPSLKEEGVPLSVAPKTLKDVIDDLVRNNRRVIFTMGKGGVGKTTIASAIALALSKMGKKVVLATTDPAHHLENAIDQDCGLSSVYIDEKKALSDYEKEVLNQAEKNGLAKDDIDYIKEDLRSPCTQEIASFRAFAKIVEKADDAIVVIDTAPTGHTLMLLESTENYAKQIAHTGGVPKEVERLLPRLKGPETEVLVVTLPEATPYDESNRLVADLHRTGIRVKWWIVNSSLSLARTHNVVLGARAAAEAKWVNKIGQKNKGDYVLIPWLGDELKDEKLMELFGETK